MSALTALVAQLIGITIMTTGIGIAIFRAAEAWEIGPTPRKVVLGLLAVGIITGFAIELGLFIPTIIATYLGFFQVTPRIARLIGVSPPDTDQIPEEVTEILPD